MPREQGITTKLKVKSIRLGEKIQKDSNSKLNAIVNCDFEMFKEANESF